MVQMNFVQVLIRHIPLEAQLGLLGPAPIGNKCRANRQAALGISLKCHVVSVVCRSMGSVDGEYGPSQIIDELN
jgi:hypothetical protein